MSEPIVGALTGDELMDLVRRAFRPRSTDTGLAVLVDLPDAAIPDRPAWAARRRMALDWVDRLVPRKMHLAFGTDLFLYRNVRRANADLPATVWQHKGGDLPATADDLDPADAVPLDQVLRTHSLVLAPTEFSATAPLKMAGKLLGIRGATMPGFGPSMMAALRLDLEAIERRVRRLADLLDRATGAEIEFRVDGQRTCVLRMDLRHRAAHVSAGVFREPGEVGNLPAGEAYIVPYEGELAGDPSRTAGELPVQIDDEVVVYRVEGNRAKAVETGGKVAAAELDHVLREPAYANLAELGLGVLTGFGVKPVGDTLLDEKLGLHVAFGRSEHFGGQVGPAQFSSPDAVIHLDRVYLPETQPRVAVPRVDLIGADGSLSPLMRDGVYVPEAIG